MIHFCMKYAHFRRKRWSKTKDGGVLHRRGGQKYQFFKSYKF